MSSMWQQAGGLSVLTRSWRVGERESGYTKRGEKVEVRGSLVHISSTIYKHTHTLGSMLHSRAPLLGASVDEMAEFLLATDVFFLALII